MKIKAIPILNIYNSFKEIGFEQDEFVMAMTELCFKWVNTPLDEVDQVIKHYLTTMLDVNETLANILIVNCSHQLVSIAVLLQSLKKQQALTNWFITPTSLMVELQ